MAYFGHFRHFHQVFPRFRHVGLRPFSVILRYNFTQRHWSKVTTMSVQPTARTFHKTVVHEGFMYILGGFDGRRLNDMRPTRNGLL